MIIIVGWIFIVMGALVLIAKLVTSEAFGDFICCVGSSDGGSSSGGSFGGGSSGGGGASGSF
jgi:hypothetical protein